MLAEVAFLTCLGRELQMAALEYMENLVSFWRIYFLSLTAIPKL